MAATKCGRDCSRNPPSLNKKWGHLKVTPCIPLRDSALLCWGAALPPPKSREASPSPPSPCQHPKLKGALHPLRFLCLLAKNAQRVASRPDPRHSTGMLWIDQWQSPDAVSHH